MSQQQLEQQYQEIGDHLVLTDGVVKGSMFGDQCLKINKKAFAMFYKGDMVFKLPEGNNAAALEGAATFEPSPGKQMNGWLRVPNDHAEQWEELSGAALQYVRSLTE
ncbi:TfoX-like protein [Paenibacillus taihuensis]|uniref:TfoX-like protein n=1 Tax=Paenibacillus taihuensis TaxID=1156355 RepID=A0A3D9SA96_9BACL|nr:MmcQ/YjbR family DNA-binding protein [Paenibacillus taihuensis]REE86493.1 TfoX-like protein [Paenibacillus taihuensis]